MDKFQRFYGNKKNLPVVVSGQDFDLTDSFLGYDLDGFRYKKFAKYPSHLFNEYMENVYSAKEPSYICYANDLIKDGIVPEWLCALESTCSGISECVQEVVAGKVLNYFKCPVVYDMLARSENGNLCVLSLDFISEGEKFYTLHDLGISITDLRNLPCDVSRRIFEIFRKKEFDIEQSFNFHKVHRMTANIIADLLYSVLIRSRILRDSDIHEGNFGVLINAKEGTIKMAPNFDLEKSFSTNEGVFNDGEDVILEYVALNYPKVFEKFVKMFNHFQTKSPITNRRYSDYIMSAKSGNSVFRLDRECEQVLENSLQRTDEEINDILKRGAHRYEVSKEGDSREI